MGRTSASYLVMITVFYGGVCVLLFEIARQGFISTLGLLVPVTLMFKSYIEHMEYNPLHRNPNFFSMSGVIGVVTSRLEHIHGGRSTLKIAIRKDYVTDDKWERTGGMEGLMAHLSGQVKYTLTDDTSKFLSIPTENCEAREGCIIYLGSLSKKPVKTLDEHLLAELSQSRESVKRLWTVVERANALANAMANEKKAELRQMAQELSIMFRELNEAKGQFQGDERVPSPYRGGYR